MTALSSMAVVFLTVVSLSLAATPASADVNTSCSKSSRVESGGPVTASCRFQCEDGATIRIKVTTAALIPFLFTPPDVRDSFVMCGSNNPPFKLECKDNPPDNSECDETATSTDGGAAACVAVVKPAGTPYEVSFECSAEPPSGCAERVVDAVWGFLKGCFGAASSKAIDMALGALPKH